MTDPSNTEQKNPFHQISDALHLLARYQLNLDGLFEDEDAEIVDCQLLVSELCKERSEMRIKVKDTLPSIFINKVRVKALFHTLFLGCAHLEDFKETKCFYLQCKGTKKQWSFSVYCSTAQSRCKRVVEVPHWFKTTYGIVDFYNGKFWIRKNKNQIVAVCFSLPILK